MELTATELWARIQKSARGSIPEHAYLTWVAAAKAVALTSDELQVEVPSRFHVEWLEDKFGTVLAGVTPHIDPFSLAHLPTALPPGSYATWSRSI